MTGWVVQRQADKKYFSGLRTAEWTEFVSGAAAFVSKSDALAEIHGRGYRVTAMLYLILPKVGYRSSWVQ